ncbi:MAGE protein [Penicillium sp. DV-2018c]|nr:MAGE protein [Penicillium sp. DV-2018c]
MPPTQKRRATGTFETPNANRRRRQSEDPESSVAAGSDEDGPSAPSSTDAMVKKLVRLALASEYSRLTIRRTDISAKVLGEQGSRQFKQVFNQAQAELRERFGMEMNELPVREKITISQRRAAQKVEKQSTANKSWIVTTTLPLAYRTPEILIPTRAPSLYTESTYIGLYSFIIAVILLNGGSLAEQKLDRYLARTNADMGTPIDRTEKLLQRLCKEGYIVKMREMDGGEEIVEYVVGPRGKVEVDAGAVAGLVRTVYGKAQGVGDRGDMSQLERDDLEDFEGRLSRSLGVKPAVVLDGEGDGDGDADGDADDGDVPPSTGRRRSSRRGPGRGNSEEEDSD